MILFDRMTSNSNQKQILSLKTEKDEINYLIKHHPFFGYTDFSQYKLIYFYNHVDSILQKGPTCGLISLLMAEKMINGKSSINLERLLERARQEKLTNNGEMFSATGIQTLATKFLNLSAITLINMEKNRETIISNLLNGNCILIPYDAAPNHEPCLKTGKKSHWCVSTGFAFRVTIEKFVQIVNDTDMANKSIFDLNDFKNETDLMMRLIDESSDLNLLCKQGKSKHLKLFSFESLVESNQNLHNVDDSRDSESFVIPEEGLSRSLCNKFVRLAFFSKYL